MQDDRLITTNRIVDLHEVLMNSNAGIRKLPGTVIKNQATGHLREASVRQVQLLRKPATRTDL